MRLTKQTCKIHHCPIIEFEDGKVACWVAYAQQLIGHTIVDIVVDEGVLVWIFENYMTIPLTGWFGNKSLAQSGWNVDTHLDIMAGAVLLDVSWDVEDDQGHLLVGEENMADMEEYWWGITIQRSLTVKEN